jgi:hypothetical protein
MNATRFERMTLWISALLESHALPLRHASKVWIRRYLEIPVAGEGAAADKIYNPQSFEVCDSNVSEDSERRERNEGRKRKRQTKGVENISALRNASLLVSIQKCSGNSGCMYLSVRRLGQCSICFTSFTDTSDPAGSNQEWHTGTMSMTTRTHWKNINSKKNSGMIPIVGYL